MRALYTLTYGLCNDKNKEHVNVKKNIRKPSDKCLDFHSGKEKKSLNKTFHDFDISDSPLNSHHLAPPRHFDCVQHKQCKKKRREKKKPSFILTCVCEAVFDR